MATYVATPSINGNSAFTAGPAGQQYTAYSKYSLTGALALNDVIQMLRVPKNAKITDIILKSADIDSNGTPLVQMTVGDASSTARLMAAQTIGQAGGSATTLAAGGVFYTYTVETVISVYISAAPATSATTGDIELAVKYILPQIAT